MTDNTQEEQFGIDVSDVGNANEDNYASLLKEVLNTGVICSNRTGINTKAMEGISSNYLLLGNCIPLLARKKIFTKSLLVELEWYLKGETNIKFLKDNGVGIWDQWADENGDLGPVYGKQWRNWVDTKVVTADECNKLSLPQRGYVNLGRVENTDKFVFQKSYDQLQDAIDKLNNNPDDRRIIISAWNVGEINDMQLPPCHAFWQLISRELEEKDRFIVALTLGKVHNDHGYDSNECKFFNEYVTKHECLDFEEVVYMMNRYQIPKRRLSCLLYQRSVDTFIGMPFNIAGYSILTHFFAHLTNHFADSFFHFGGDVHVYQDHIDGIKEYLQRDIGKDYSPKVFFPLEWNKLEDFKWEDVKIVDYEPMSAIKVPVAK